MARTISIPALPHCHPHCCRPHHYFTRLSLAQPWQSFIRFPVRRHCNLSLPVSATHSSSSSASTSSLPNSLRTGRFLTDEDLEKLDLLSNFSYHHKLESGFLWVRVMREEEMDMAVALLSESFAESMMIASGYAKLLQFLIKNYLIERREMMPHNATLLGIYRENEEEDFELAGTVELTFGIKGANANPPTPTPPKNSPYICNMAVRKPLRRRGIGWHLLKAGEELVSQMSSSRDVHLHCRMIDEGPLNMYMKAGYKIVKTDSILTLLTLQRRRYLMRKDLAVSEDASEPDILDEQPS